MKKIIALGILLFCVVIISFGYYIFNEMTKEDSQGEFYDLYNRIDKNDNYFVIIDEKEAFFTKLFGDNLLFKMVIVIKKLKILVIIILEFIAFPQIKPI
ncbi:MAG: hypothetical protein HC854_17780 [Flavobacterium sp.]|nr:hypothetical protein [Flavobacterium sp.]